MVNTSGIMSGLIEHHALSPIHSSASDSATAGTASKVWAASANRQLSNQPLPRGPYSEHDRNPHRTSWHPPVATTATKSGPPVEAWDLISPVDGQPDGFVFFSSCLFFWDDEYCSYYVSDAEHHCCPEPLSRIEKLFLALLYQEFCEKFLCSSDREAKEWLAQTANVAQDKPNSIAMIIHEPPFCSNATSPHASTITTTAPGICGHSLLVGQLALLLTGNQFPRNAH